MTYVLENSKWNAYQYSDPFAVGSFFVCIEPTNCFCRPDCDMKYASHSLNSKVTFVTEAIHAMSRGYNPCIYCNPTNSPILNIKLLMDCVLTVNSWIDYTPVSNEDIKNNKHTKELINDNKKFNFTKTDEKQIRRTTSLPEINSYAHTHKRKYNEKNVTKSNMYNYRVNLACRHMALAAAEKVSSQCIKYNWISSTTPKQKKKKSGIIGFKELAAKSKLSAWHFHRLFTSVTGVTPKTYGDKCLAFMKDNTNSSNITNIGDCIPSILVSNFSPSKLSEDAHFSSYESVNSDSSSDLISDGLLHTFNSEEDVSFETKIINLDSRISKVGATAWSNSFFLKKKSESSIATINNMNITAEPVSGYKVAKFETLYGPHHFNNQKIDQNILTNNLCALFDTDISNTLNDSFLSREESTLIDEISADQSNKTPCDHDKFISSFNNLMKSQYFFSESINSNELLY